MSIASIVPIAIFGLRQSLRDPFAYLDDASFVYLAGSNVIVYSPANGAQKIIPTLVKDARLTAITITRERHYVAIAESAEKKITVQILGLPTFRRRKAISVSEVYPAINRTPKDVVGISFSSDSKLMAVLTGDLFMSYWVWEKSRLLAKTFVMNDPTEYKAITISVNPTDENMVAVYGKGIVRIYRLMDKEFILNQIELPLPESEVFSFSWLSAIRFVLGSYGTIYIFENGSFKNSTTLVPIPQNLSPESLAMSKLELAIECLLLTTRMLIASCNHTVYIFDRNAHDHPELLKLTHTMPAGEMKLRSIAISPSEEQLLLVTENCSCSTLVQTDAVKPVPCLPTFHELPITGMDISIRKSLIVTCSADRSIRLWDFTSLTCEMCKFFAEEPLSVSIHPSGYFLLAGFSDKLRLMNILLDELRVVREFPIRSSRECAFSNGGHLFAASQGSVISIYNFWSYELQNTLKGHNGKILSLKWTNGDVCLISCGSDGAVYTWNLATMKRDNEFIMKGVTFASAVDFNKTNYAAGSDRTIKVISESMLVKDLVTSVECTQLAISHSGKMFFAGTKIGSICSLRFPFPKEAQDVVKDELAQEHMIHAGTVVKLRITFDDKFMLSAGEDGCLCIFRISEPDSGSTRQGAAKPNAGDWAYAQEVLVNKGDHLERISNISDLKTRLEEINMEHDYQLRLKSMHLQDALRDLTNEKSKIVESLKVNLVVQRTEKEKDEARNKGLYTALVARNQTEFSALENKYSQKLMSEYENFQNSQNALRKKQEKWEKDIQEFEEGKTTAVDSLTTHFENLCINRQRELIKFQDDLTGQSKEHKEHLRQLMEDLDTEAICFQKHYEAQLKSEREQNFRLKGENGIMKKKFLVLTKEIEDNKLELIKLNENENRLRKIMTSLEREVDGLRTEMVDRDKMIQEQEKRVYELKKCNQELEKYKFVLDYKIKDLKLQIEPREEKISDLKDQINIINDTLGSLREKEERMKESHKHLEETFEKCIKTKAKEHHKLQSLQHLVKQFQTDLTLAMDYIQEPAVLKRIGLNLRHKYCKKMAAAKPKEPEEGELELQNQQVMLHKTAQRLKKESAQNSRKFRQEHFVWVQENKKLLNEIKELQQIKGSLPALNTPYSQLSAMVPATK